MRVSEFYASSCATKKAMRALTESPMNAEYRATRRLCDAICEGSNLQAAIDAFKGELQENLKAEDFPFEWQKTQRVDDDVKCIERFFGYLGDRRFVSSNKKVSAGQFECTVSLITEKEGLFDAYIIKWHKADKSPAGKSMHTNVSTDLYALVAKAGLEETYPNVKVNLVYMRNDNDAAGAVTNFIVAKSKKSNVFTLSFEDFYNEGSMFEREAILGEIKRVTSEAPPKDCFNCKYTGACAANTVSNSRPVAEKTVGKTEWRMPERFTKAQTEVIDLVDGPAVVCAGPGSGKTATLVGRIKRLIDDEGIDPEFILAITFTKDAAGELLARCRSFCEEDSMPQIMTLNAFGYMILQKNPDYLGRPVKLLGVTDRKKLIKTLYDAKGPIKGFSDTMIYGRNGLLNTLERKMNDYEASPEEFLQKNPQYGNDFVSFVETFERAVEEHGYITYDEQITMATALLKNNPACLDAVTARYKYIMVDEFQDIDQAQADLIYLISRRSHNLVVVGDDDQSIYGFRGGSNRYMLDFKRVFPEAKQIVLTENFRSTENLVNEASGFISRNKRRIGKEVRSTRGKGMAPVIRQGQGAEDVSKAVAELQKGGYRLADIAILATKNATLEELAREVDFPSVLGKSYLIESPAFKCLYGALKISHSYDEGIMASTLLTMGVALNELPAEKGVLESALVTDGTLEKSALNNALCMFKSWLKLIKENCSIATLLDRVFSDIGYGQSADSEAMYDVLESRKDIRNLDSLRELVTDMVNFSSDTRIESNTEGAVLLITSHESKGMEWRAVILVDDFTVDGSEETNRLYYVAMTRAKDALYILTDGEGTLLNKAI